MLMAVTLSQATAAAWQDGQVTSALPLAAGPGFSLHPHDSSSPIIFFLPAPPLHLLPFSPVRRYLLRTCYAEVLFSGQHISVLTGIQPVYREHGASEPQSLHLPHKPSCYTKGNPCHFSAAHWSHGPISHQTHLHLLVGLLPSALPR